MFIFNLRSYHQMIYDLIDRGSLEGICWNAEEKKFFFAAEFSRDSDAQHICCYDSKQLHHHRKISINHRSKTKQNNREEFYFY